jgi:chromosome segregation ATPase
MAVLVEDDLASQLNSAALTDEEIASAVLAWCLEQKSHVAARESEEGMDQLLEFLKAQVGQLADKTTVAAIAAQVEALVESARVQAGQGDLVARVADLEGKLSDANTALEAARAELLAAQHTIEEQGAELQSRDVRITELDAANATRSTAERLAARLAELPEHIRQVHQASEETKRTETEARWAAKTDAEWQEVLDTFAMAPMVPKTAGYLFRSQQEGVLPSSGGSKSGKPIADRLAPFRK